MDQKVNATAFVMLDGSASFDPQGRPLAFQWSFGAMTPGLPPTLDGTTNGPGYAWVSQVLQ